MDCLYLENPLKLDDLGYPHDLGNIHLAIVIYKSNKSQKS